MTMKKTIKIVCKCGEIHRVETELIGSHLSLVVISKNASLVEMPFS